MIDGFDASDQLHQFRIMLVNVLHEFGLGIARAGDQHRAGIGDRLDDGVQEVLVGRGVAAADRVGLVMDVLGRIIRMQNQFIRLPGNASEVR